MPKTVDSSTESKGLQIDKEIKDVQAQIKHVDAQIKALNNRRIVLVEKYDQLNESKLMFEAEASASEQNWESGK